jgi:hypothetical protein
MIEQKNGVKDMEICINSKPNHSLIRKEILMRIEKENNSYNKNITNLEIGETFLYKGQLHIKIHGGSLEQFLSDTYPNLILNLETNKLNSMSHNVDVTPITAKVVI